MEYNNGFAKDKFLQHMFEEFPSVFNTSFSREMLENIVDYGVANHTVTKNGLYYYLKDMVPEAGPVDLIPYIDKSLLTGEVLWLVDEPKANVDIVAKYDKIVQCDLEGIESFDYYENCFLLTSDDIEADCGLEIELTGEFFFNTEFKSLNRKVVEEVNSIDELVEFCNEHNISIPDECRSHEGYLCVGGEREYVVDDGLWALGWEDELLATVDNKLADAQERSEASIVDGGKTDLDIEIG